MRSIVGMLLLAAVLWGAMEALGSVVRLSGDHPLWAVALVAASAAELLRRLYGYERKVVPPRRARWLLGLRWGVLLVLLWMWLEPSWVRTLEKERSREVVVLIDDSASMHLTDDGETSGRRETGKRALEESGLLAELGETLKVRTLLVARGVRSGEDGTDAAWSGATDLAGALGAALEQVPPDDLAGAVLVSDGRHNRPARVEDAARRFGILDAPVGVIAVGSENPPRDAAITDLRAPDAIHLGDRMRIVASMKFDGFKGGKAMLRLSREGEVLEEREVMIPQDRHREEVRFSVIPGEGGTAGYRVEIVPMDGERFPENNAWDFETSITDARTNVLIVESHPRWEFRYLRNLFHGRDKSVHLQYVLLNPDRIAGQEDLFLPASASRPFGESRATRLPPGEAEWRKFDVIILGDLAPDALGEEEWEILSRCVNERAALLVMIAGPRSMPHAIASAAGRVLVPAEFDWGKREYFAAGGEGFRFAVTADGASHPVTADDAFVWREFPEMRWRHPLKALKEGAEVLLTADRGDEPQEAGSGEDLERALDALARRREREAEGALLVTRQTGRGKVALLLTDRTWRLREGAGDVHHHRFWGNLIRWGAGPAPRGGSGGARIGTDQLAYTPDDVVKVEARLRDGSLAPVFDPSLTVDVTRDGRLLASLPLAAVEGSNGLHEAAAGPFAEAGRYELRLRGDRVEELAAGGDPVAAFRVVGSRGPVELADVTLNRPLLDGIASLSGGKVVDPYRAGELADLFLSDKRRREETRETPLWDHWIVLSLAALLLGAEWTLRRSGGLP